MSTHPSLVCLSGTLCDRRLWQAQESAFSAQFDFLYPKQGTTPNLQGQAAQILADLPKTFALAGMSAGVVLAFEMLRQAPQRITQLLLIAGNPNGNTPQMREAFKRRREDFKQLGAEQVIKQQVLAELLSANSLANPMIVKTIVDMAVSADPAAYFATLEQLIQRPSSLETLAGYGRPVLAVGGQSDRLCTPQMQEAMSAAAPQGEHHILKNCGHYVNLEAPEALNALLQTWFENTSSL